jgi:hypothetical protein
MRKEKKKKLKMAHESLDDIIKRIGPFLPKTPQAKQKPEPTWERSDIDVLPIPTHKIQSSI